MEAATKKPKVKVVLEQTSVMVTTEDTEKKPKTKVVRKPRVIKEPVFSVRDTFLDLTSYTYPHGHEHKLRNRLPEGAGMDKHGNYFYNVGSSKTVFACHLDTVSKEYKKVKHVIEGNIIRTDGTSTLGADDKAGVTVLLYLISKRVPGMYYFFIGEEVGCIGSKAASKHDNFTDYDRIVSFDRRNTCSIITFQAGSRCCSQDFANALSQEYDKLGLKLTPDDTGVYTDSAEFTGIIPECTNISVGYYSEHTHAERQDIDFLEKLCEASANINWEGLPTVRNPKVKESKKYSYSGHGYSGHGGYSSYNQSSRTRAQHWNNTNHNNHNRGKKWKNHDFHEYDFLEHDVFNHTSDETLIDYALEEDKKKNKKNKKNKKSDDVIISEYQHREINSDVYLTYMEYLSESNFIEDSLTSGSAPMFTIREYAILDEILGMV